MKIYNTYTREKENFSPIDQNSVKMYVCGPTVYDYIHIGNARPVIFFDVVRRFFENQNYKVDYVSNITDVDDKIINKALEVGVEERDISDKFLAQYIQDCTMLNVLPLRAMPKVTESMEEIIEFIEDLVKRDFAYEVKGDIYFRVNKVDEYGKLSGKKIDDLVVGARVEANTKKENPVDFTLWKKTEVGITWQSPWGMGRPGWHTECVVMIDDAFGGKIDIHGGGSDLQFPHHENEIAQSICHAGHTIANTWMHVGRLGLDDEKMSKSIGNVILVKDLLKEWETNAFRLFMLSTHYRQPINFSYEVLEASKKEWDKIKQAADSLNLHINLQSGISVIENDEITSHKSAFIEAMVDDFNTANAFTALFGLIKTVNKLVRQKQPVGELLYAKKVLQEMFFTLGLDYSFETIDEQILNLYREWEVARINKDFNQADILRAQLVTAGLL